MFAGRRLRGQGNARLQLRWLRRSHQPRPRANWSDPHRLPGRVGGILSAGVLIFCVAAPCAPGTPRAIADRRANVQRNAHQNGCCLTARTQRFKHPPQAPTLQPTCRENPTQVIAGRGAIVAAADSSLTGTWRRPSPARASSPAPPFTTRPFADHACGHESAQNSDQDMYRGTALSQTSFSFHT